MSGNIENLYEVLSPWADADPVSFRAINSRVNDLTGKKIGLFCNTKRVAEPTLKVVEDRFKNNYPSVTVNWFYNTAPNEAIVEQTRKDEFENWLKGVDIVIAAYGD
jgi:ABC-type lipopolysaccharide export system ATPase subunit